MFRLFSGALQNAAAAEDWSRAVLTAESRLAAAASAQPLVETEERGDERDSGIRWVTRVRFWDPPNVEPELARLSEGMTTRLFRIEVDLSFPGVAGGERSLSLATVRMAAKDAPR